MPFIALTIESALTEGLPIDVASILSLVVSVIGVTMFYYTNINFRCSAGGGRMRARAWSGTG